MSTLETLDIMIAETRARRLEYRRKGAKPKPVGNSNQIFALACAIREQALRDARDALTGQTSTDYPYGPERKDPT